eukprot:s748_g1.t1
MRPQAERSRDAAQERSKPWPAFPIIARAIQSAQPIPVGTIRPEKCGRAGRSRHRPRPRRSSGRRIHEDPGNGTDLSQMLGDIRMDVEDVIKVMKAEVGNP